MACISILTFISIFISNYKMVLKGSLYYFAIHYTKSSILIAFGAFYQDEALEGCLGKKGIWEIFTKT